MSDKVLKSPQIRFAGYTDNWEESVLGESMMFSNGINAPKENYGKGRKMISVMDILAEESITYEKIRNSVSVDKKIEDKNKVENGDLIFVRSSEVSEEVGWAKAYLQDEYALYSGFSIRGKRTNNYDAYFMELSLNNVNRKHIESKAGGSTRFNVSQEILKSIIILQPTFSEQVEISSFFSVLDHLITLQKQKLGLLKETKKSLLQKMFPRKGANVPELRFAGFTDAWEQRRLGDYAEILTGGTPKTSVLKYWEPKEIPWMSSGEVHKRRLDETDSMISKEGLNESSARWIKEHSVLIALAGQGKTRGTVAINNIPLTTNQSIAAIVPNETLYYEFIFQNLVKRYDELRRVSSGDGTRGGLNKQIISNVIMPFTNIEEQKKISRFLSNFDNLIILQQRELNALKNLKKSLLHQMFV